MLIAWAGITISDSTRNATRPSTYAGMMYDSALNRIYANMKNSANVKGDTEATEGNERQRKCIE
jgi:hypothetical protein